MSKKNLISIGMSFVLAVFVTATVGIASAQEEDHEHDHPDSERTKFMKKFGGNASVLGKVLRGEAEFNVVLATNAQAISDLAGELTAQFPQGSKDHRAKAEIWDNWDDFASKADKLRTEAQKLADLIKGNDAAGFPAQFMATVGNCKSCHDDYRIPEEE